MRGVVFVPGFPEPDLLPSSLPPAKDRLWVELAADPCHEHLYGIALFVGRKFPACGNAMPFGETSPATASRGMLGNEHRVSPHGRLLAVVGDDGRGQPLAYKVGGVAADGVRSFLVYVGDVGRFQAEPASERRVGKPFEKVGEVVFGRGLFRGPGFGILCLTEQIRKKSVHRYVSFRLWRKGTQFIGSPDEKISCG